jgi:hypothetical protein
LSTQRRGAFACGRPQAIHSQPSFARGFSPFASTAVRDPLARTWLGKSREARLHQGVMCDGGIENDVDRLYLEARSSMGEVGVLIDRTSKKEPCYPRKKSRPRLATLAASQSYRQVRTDRARKFK